MMPEMTQDDPLPGAACRNREMDTLEARFGALMEDLATNPDRPDLARRMSLLTAAFREDRAELVNLRFAVELAAIERDRTAAPPPRQRTGRHSAVSLPQRALRVVTGIAGGLGLTGVLRAALRTSRIAHAPVAAKAALAGAGTVAVLTAGAAVVPHASGILPFGGSQGGTPNPAASIYSATPIPASPSGSPPLAALVTRPRTSLDAKSAADIDPLVLPVPSSYTPPGPAPQQQQQQPAPQQPQVPAPPSDPAVLEVSTPALDLTVLPSATFTLTAAGDSGWVSWHIDKQGAAALDFTPAHGVLAAGQSVTVTVSLSPYQNGAAQEVFNVNGIPVTVALPPLPVPSPPDVVPSDVPTAVPSPSAS